MPKTPSQLADEIIKTINSFKYRPGSLDQYVNDIDKTKIDTLPDDQKARVNEAYQSHRKVLEIAHVKKTNLDTALAYQKLYEQATVVHPKPTELNNENAHNEEESSCCCLSSLFGQQKAKEHPPLSVETTHLFYAGK